MLLVYLALNALIHFYLKCHFYSAQYYLTFRYIHLLVPRRFDPTHTVTDGLYEDEYSCFPPPVGMIIISIVEIIFYIIDEGLLPGSTMTAKGPVAELFIYDPHRRREAWRFLTYMLVHVG